MIRRRLIICDLDGVLADERWRRNYANSGMWEAYHSRCPQDHPNWDFLFMVRGLGFSENCDYNVVYLTGRDERFRAETLGWLAQHEAPGAVLLMRPKDNYEKTSKMKLDLLAREFGEDWAQQVAFVIDDDERNCEAFSSAGVSVLRASPRSQSDEISPPLDQAAPPEEA